MSPEILPAATDSSSGSFDRPAHEYSAERAGQTDAPTAKVSSAVVIKGTVEASVRVAPQPAQAAGTEGPPVRTDGG